MRPTYPSVALLLASAALAGCSSNGIAKAPAEPPPPPSVAGVQLRPIPASAVAACRSAQARSRITILCPRHLPRAVHDSSGSSAVPTDPLVVTQRAPGPRDVTGLDFSYSGPTEDPAQDVPERFLHFVVQQQDAPLPPGVKRATLGGKAGLLAPASTHDYWNESYFGNHWRFFWTEGGVDYAATLHDFGPRAKDVLAALIADLRPARELKPPPSKGAIPVPIGGPVSVAVAGGAVWVAGQGQANDDRIRSASLVRVDPLSLRATGPPVRVGRYLGTTALAAGDGSLWIAHRGLHRNDVLRLLDPAAGRFTGRVATGGQLVAVAAAADSVWAVDIGGWPGDPRYRGGNAIRVDPATGRVVARVRMGRAPAAVTIGSGGVWVTNNLDGVVSRIDPRTNRVAATIDVGAEPVGVAADARAVWVASSRDGLLCRIDPATNQVVARIPVGRRPRAVAVAPDGIWVTNTLDDTVSRIDPERNAVAETVRVGAGPTGLAYGQGALWVANNEDASITRVESP